LVLTIIVDIAKYLYQVYMIDASRIFVHLLAAALGPTLPPPTSAQHGSYRRISCRR
jgi:hypothetical protein